MARQLIQAQEITITSGTTTAAINLDNRVLVGVQTPSGIASTTMKIQGAKTSDGTFVAVYDPLGLYGTVGDITFTIAASKIIPIPPQITDTVMTCKLEFGSSETSKTYIVYTREIE